MISFKEKNGNELPPRIQDEIHKQCRHLREPIKVHRSASWLSCLRTTARGTPSHTLSSHAALSFRYLEEVLAHQTSTQGGPTGRKIAEQFQDMQSSTSSSMNRACKTPRCRQKGHNRRHVEIKTKTKNNIEIQNSFLCDTPYISEDISHANLPLYGSHPLARVS